MCIRDSGEADAVAFGQLFIANPDLPARFTSRASVSYTHLGALRLHCGKRLQAGSSCAHSAKGEDTVRVGIASDHGGFVLKEQIANLLRGAAHEVVDFGALHPSPGDDYPDYVIPLARAVAAGKVDRGIALCGLSLIHI